MSNTSAVSSQHGQYLTPQGADVRRPGLGTVFDSVHNIACASIQEECLDNDKTGTKT